MSRQIQIAPNWRREAAERGILIRPLSSRIGSEVTHLDLAAEPDREVVAILRAACADRGVLVFRGWRNIPRAALHAFASAVARPQARGQSIALIHTVNTALRFGETRFVDGTAAYDALAPELRHEFAAAETGTARPLVRAHEPSGDPCLDIVGIDLRNLEGLPKKQAQTLGATLDAHVLRLRLAYTHRWRDGDILLVEDRCRMHAAPGNVTPLATARAAERPKLAERVA